MTAGYCRPLVAAAHRENPMPVSPHHPACRRPAIRRPAAGGFTLLEILISITIILILVGLLFPAITKIRLASYKAATQNQISVVSVALQQYYTDFNAYPGPLPVEQLDTADGLTNADPRTPTSGQPFIYDTAGNTVNLTWAANASLPTTTDFTHITGNENCVLGLCGGLVVNQLTTPVTFTYDSSQVFPDTANVNDLSPDPKGPRSLGFNNVKSHTAYLNPKAGELSSPYQNFATTDNAGIVAKDTFLPELVDKYPTPMPFLYMRASRGAVGVATFAGKDGLGGTAISTTSTTGSTVPLPCQYDLREVYGYTGSNIGLTLNDPRVSGPGGGHGLQYVWYPSGTPPTTTNIPSGGRTLQTAPEIDGWAYLRNPDIGPQPVSGNITQTDTGAPRSKDSYVLISPGPDRIYGTIDDIVSFGSVQP